MTHEERIEWMAVWAAKNGVQLDLKGECGFGRECVGITTKGKFPDYQDYDDWDDSIWQPKDAYHKHPCVAVLGRGEKAETQLYEWLKWFDDNGYTVKVTEAQPDPRIPIALSLMLGKHISVRMVKRDEL